MLVSHQLVRRRPRSHRRQQPYPERFPCEIRRLPLDCYCNSGVNSQLRREDACLPGGSGSTSGDFAAPSALRGGIQTTARIFENASIGWVIAKTIKSLCINMTIQSKNDGNRDLKTYCFLDGLLLLALLPVHRQLKAARAEVWPRPRQRPLRQQQRRGGGEERQDCPRRALQRRP